MADARYTKFCVLVKEHALRRGIQMQELCAEVTERTGLYCDTGYLHKIFTGQRKAEKIVAAIKEILEIE